MDNTNNILARLSNFLIYIIDTPVTLFREKIVEPNQKKYPWYHQQFRRVPTIDTCHLHDVVCIQEANSQYERDRMVDSDILAILRSRYEDCVVVNDPDRHICQPLYDTYVEASGAWFTKYGDLGYNDTVIRAFMKQKHRMIWERRHGPVGSGMKDSYDLPKEEHKIYDPPKTG